MWSKSTLTSSYPDNEGTKKSGCHNERQNLVQGGIMTERPALATAGPLFGLQEQVCTRQ